MLPGLRLGLVFGGFWVVGCCGLLVLLVLCGLVSGLFWGWCISDDLGLVIWRCCADLVISGVCLVVDISVGFVIC